MSVGRVAEVAKADITTCPPSPAAFHDQAGVHVTRHEVIGVADSRDHEPVPLLRAAVGGCGVGGRRQAQCHLQHAPPQAAAHQEAHEEAAETRGGRASGQRQQRPRG